MKQDFCLLHGALGSRKQMRPLAQALPSSVTIYDLAGHGLLANETEPYSIESMAERVRKFREYSEAFFGYSMGGYVALYLAAKHPEMVKSVTTLATKFDWTPEAAAAEVRMLNPDKIKEKVPAFAKQLEKRHGEFWPDVVKRTADLMLELGNNPPLTAELLQQIKCPVLLLRGSEDTMVSEQETLWAKSHIPNARYEELEGQPHVFEKMDLNLLIRKLDQ
ncbi:MAG: alpha/beta fold hydrolase [Flavobacteriales bacterium]|nr:alpha/beta fold hydrolase [Flavobacteriales bacterium]